MRIILIGFMGSGKSTIGKIIADKLGLKLIEADQLITERYPYESINQVFSELGEDAFRKMETEIAKSLKDVDNIIVSTGGGAVMKQETMEHFQSSNSKTVFLKNNFETSKKRLEGDKPRPLFQDIEKAHALYEVRLPLYKKYADIIVKTDNKLPEEIAREIANQIK